MKNTTSNELIIDAFGRIKEVVNETVAGLSEKDLLSRQSDDANSIGWLIWHLTRIQDDHIADVANIKQVWGEDGWFERFKLSYDISATGYGHSSEEVGAFQASSKLLLGYHDAVHGATVTFVRNLSNDEYQRIVDKRWDPPVTLAVRLISVITDDLQHADQAARGLLRH